MLVLPGQRIHHAPGGAAGGVGQEWGAIMNEIEKMKKYIERTKLDPNDRFYMDMREAFELAHQARTCEDFPLEIISLAFTYGKAKGYRAAKAERRARA